MPVIIINGNIINISGIGGHPLSFTSLTEIIHWKKLYRKINFIITFMILSISSKNDSASACDMNGLTLSGKNGGTVTFGCVPFYVLWKEIFDFELV